MEQHLWKVKRMVGVILGFAGLYVLNVLLLSTVEIFLINVCGNGFGINIPPGDNGGHTNFFFFW